MSVHPAVPTQLLDPAPYPWPVTSVDLIETHLSWVLLAGSRVIKVRRPVVFPFVDQRELEQRHQHCDDDIRLNRRLSTGVYLGVEPITLREGGLAIGGTGDTIEWCSVMRRLPESALLTRQIASNTLDPEVIDRLADHLSSFHLACEPCLVSSGATAGTADLDVVRDNLVELSPFAGQSVSPGLLQAVASAMTAFMQAQADLFEQRCQSGWVRDGHGDLRAEHVFLEDDGRIQVIDCVEFSAAIRCSDVASDLAFLLMDLRRLERPDEADRIVERYRARGISLPPDLLRFYQAHRALVRAKINALTVERGGLLNHENLLTEIADYSALALQMVSSIEPAMVVMTGLSGTGKSTVARRVARMLGARYLRSDVIRKSISGMTTSGPQSWQTGIYTSEWTVRTYAALLDQAHDTLADGKPVVLDASFLAQEWREGAARLGRRAGVPVVFVETVCDPEIVQQRLIDRNVRGNDPSDADLAVYRAQRSELDGLLRSIPSGADGVTVDTGLPSITCTDTILDAIQRAGIIRPGLHG